MEGCYAGAMLHQIGLCKRWLCNTPCSLCCIFTQHSVPPSPFALQIVPYSQQSCYRSLVIHLGCPPLFVADLKVNFCDLINKLVKKSNNILCSVFPFLDSSQKALQLTRLLHIINSMICMLISEGTSS